MIVQNFTKRFIVPVLIVFSFIFIYWFINYLPMFWIDAAKSPALSHIFRNDTIDAICLILLKVALLFGVFVIYPIAFFRGATLAERVAASYVNPFLWITSEVIRKSMIYYYVAPEILLFLFVILVEIVSLEVLFRWRSDAGYGFPQTKEIRIIGPHHSGKAALLASIEQAFLNWNKYESGVNLGFFPQSYSMEKLSHQYKITIKQGRLPESDINKIEEYVFDLELRRIRLRWFLGKKVVHFHVIYFPGAISFPSTEKNSYDWSSVSNFPEELLNGLNNADGFIVCLDANDNNAAFDFWVNLPRMLGEIQNKPKKIVGCFNKADKYFADEEVRAYSSLKAKNPLYYGKDFIPKSGLNCMKTYCRDVKIGVCWSSVYGFLKTRGYANYNPNNDGLLLWGDDKSYQEVIDNWTPYNVVEPFLFMTLDFVKGIKIYRTGCQQFKDWMKGKFSIFSRLLFRLKVSEAKK